MTPNEQKLSKIKTVQAMFLEYGLKVNIDYTISNKVGDVVYKRNIVIRYNNTLNKSLIMETILGDYNPKVVTDSKLRRKVISLSLKKIALYKGSLEKETPKEVGTGVKLMEKTNFPDFPNYLENSHNYFGILGTLEKRVQGKYIYIYFSELEAQYAQKLFTEKDFDCYQEGPLRIVFNVKAIPKYPKKTFFRSRPWITKVIDNYSFRCDLINFIFTYAVKIRFNQLSCEDNFIETGFTNRIDVPIYRNGQRYTYNDVVNIFSKDLGFKVLNLGSSGKKEGIVISLSKFGDSLDTENSINGIHALKDARKIISNDILNDLDQPEWKSMITKELVFKNVEHTVDEDEEVKEPQETSQTQSSPTQEVEETQLTENQLRNFYKRLPKEFRKKFAEEEFGVGTPTNGVFVDKDQPIDEVVVMVLGEPTVYKPHQLVSIKLNKLTE